jgi:soluble lytic murein transglycosylase
MRRLLRFLHRVTSGCATVPLIGAFALLMGALPVGVPWNRQERHPMAPSAAAAETVPEDFALIDSVLARRAPELGIILRRQVGVAIAEEAKAAGFDPLLVLAIIDVESDFEEEAISNKGARGLMQIKPSTLYFLAQRTGLRLSRPEVASDPALCVRLGIRYLAWLNEQFGNLDLALMAYNAGPARIRQAMRAGELDAFRRYPALVRRDFRRFRVGVGLGGDWALARRVLVSASP